MRKSFNFWGMVVVAMTALTFTACNADDDYFEESQFNGSSAETCNVNSEYTVTFSNVPSICMSSDKYGYNLYNGGTNQITEGYKLQLGNTGIYVQFPINYLQQEWGAEPRPWQYDFYNGGIAISNFTDLTTGTYLNQCSVYNEAGGIGGFDIEDNPDPFSVAYGYSDSYNDPNGTYNKCAKIYLTDAAGYKVVTEQSPVEGTVKTGTFNSVYVCNTTYTYMVMRDGNSFTADGKSLEEQGGWFKVQFIGFASDDTSAQPTGMVEYYLANFDSSKTSEAGFCGSIRTGWNQVNLTNLGNNVHMVVVNFVGSDSGDYGLNTPAYCALDNLSISL